MIALFLMSGYAWTAFINYAGSINSIIDFPGIHPMYLSMHNAVAIIMVVYLLRTERFLKAGFLLYVMGFSLGIGLILLLQKAPIFVLLITSTILCFKFNLRRIWAFYVVIIVSLSSVVIAFPSSFQRLNVLFKLESLDGIKESAEIRKIFRNCNVPALRESGFFGFGVGDGNEKLINCYADVKGDLATNKYNSHNQYVGLMLVACIFGLLVFVPFLFLNINHARNSGVFIPVAIIMFYTIVMFSENILERQEGLMYFALLINLLYFLSRENPQVVLIKHSPEELLKAIS